jgi:predicted RecA/RadA family phage recombinase
MKNYIQPGENLTLTAPYAVTPGDGLLVGSIFGVASDTAASGAEVIAVVTGVFTLAKTTGAAWTVGQVLYWDDTGKKVTHTASTNKLIGVAVKAAASGDTTGTLRLNGAFIA